MWGTRDLFRADGCRATDETKYLRVGGTLESPRVFRVESEDALAYDCLCVEGCVLTSEVRHVLRAVEDEPVNSWKAAARVRAGTGRYRYNALEVGCAVIPEPDARFFDSALAGDECQIGLAEDGEMRCLPFITAYVAYADAQCTQRIAVRADATPVPHYALEGLSPSRGFPNTAGAKRVWQVTGEGHANEPFFYQIPGELNYQAPVACHAFSDATGWTTWTLGEVVPAAAFGVLRPELR
jgi:hypothetical protein